MEVIIIVSELINPVNTRLQNKWIFTDFDTQKRSNSPINQSFLTTRRLEEAA